MRLDDLARATPATRDRYMDFLRAASIVAVVFGHWFISINHLEREVYSTTSAVGVTSWMWLGTWLFQVMPVFFFVGGFSNLVTYDSFKRRGEPTSAFVRSRLGRLLRPSLVFLGFWLVVQIALHLTNIGGPAGPRLFDGTRLLRGMHPPAATLPFGPLWFLGFYLIVVCIAPATIWLHRRFRWWVPAVMVAGAIGVDVIGFGAGLHPVRYLNVALVLLLPHQLGHFYADGTFGRLPRVAFWAMVAVGLGGLVLLTNPWVFEPFGQARFDWFPGIGHYPKSLLGTDVEKVSNAYPPTVCFLLACIWSVGAVMLLRPWLSRWLQRPAPWKVTISLNSVIMTLFLWHMTAYFVVLLALWPIGVGHQQDSTAAWWLLRPVFIGLSAIVLAGIVAVVGRFERPAQPSAGPRPGATPPARGATLV
ncbi:MAG TPA: acyltransferase [Actinomycetota bacterium]|nr:acyltransferase [Actinomycetota bacterium]